jgi:hypothetical protein
LTARNLIFDRFHDFALYCGFMVGLVYVDRCVGSFRVASPPSLLLGSFRRLGLLSSGAPCSATLRHLRSSRRPGWAMAGRPAPRYRSALSTSDVVLLSSYAIVLCCRSGSGLLAVPRNTSGYCTMSHATGNTSAVIFIRGASCALYNASVCTASLRRASRVVTVVRRFLLVEMMDSFSKIFRKSLVDNELADHFAWSDIDGNAIKRLADNALTRSPHFAVNHADRGSNLATGDRGRGGCLWSGCCGREKPPAASPASSSQQPNCGCCRDGVGSATLTIRPDTEGY